MQKPLQKTRCSWELGYGAGAGGGEPSPLAVPTRPGPELSPIVDPGTQWSLSSCLTIWLFFIPSRF